MSASRFGHVAGLVGIALDLAHTRAMRAEIRRTLA
jgi:hypothetical protein